MTGDAVSVARRAIPLIDHMDLSSTATATSIDRLCLEAVTAYGSVAAVTVAPRYVARARKALIGTGVRVATLVNFPRGEDEPSEILSETAEAIQDGVDELELVLPYRAFLDGRMDLAESTIRAVRSACLTRARFGVVLETGEIGHLTKLAARLALEAGADFLTTSTGWAKVNASVEAARAVLSVVDAIGRTGIGFKVTGDLATIDDAASYLALADDAMGTGWARPRHFRLGSPGLLDVLIGVMEGRAVAPALEQGLER